MNALLDFFSDLILFTFGLAVLVFWIVMIVVVCIEMYDAFKGDPSTDEEDEL